MIQLKNVTKVYETGGVKTPALNGISLDIKMESTYRLWGLPVPVKVRC